jgi:hypothetical protein
MSAAARILKDGTFKTIYVNRPQVEKNRAGERGPVWVVEEESEETITLYNAYSFMGLDGFMGNTPLDAARKDGVSVYLTTMGRMLLRITPDLLDPDWVTVSNFFGKG